MKKIIVVLIIIAAAAAGYIFWQKPGSPVPAEGETTNPSITPPAPVSHNEADMGESPEPTTPPPTPPQASPTPPPAGGPVQDDLGDVDVAPPKVFNLTGKNFSFSQDEIRVKKGDRVVINFESTDGLHDWVVDEFNAKTDRVNPGTKASVEFIADKSGSFEYYCSVSIHRAAGMKGKLIVE